MNSYEQSGASVMVESLPPAPVQTAPAKGLRGLLSRWWVAFSASAIFVVSGHLLIKFGLNAAAAHPVTAGTIGKILHIVLQPEVFVGLLIYGLGSACWIVAVAQQEISFLYPLSSLNYVLVAGASVLFFHEAISGKRGAGLALIVLGMVLMNRKSRGPAQ
jgi:drug/metabolite transporter (DMT)-like permease